MLSPPGLLGLVLITGSLIDLADAYDINIPAHENPVYVARVREMGEQIERELTQRRNQKKAEADARSDDADITDIEASTQG